MRRARAGLLAGIAAIAVAACTVWNGAALPTSEAPLVEGGAPDAGCARNSVPSKAPPPDLGTGGDIEIIVAVQRISLGLQSSGKVDPDFGYDLDNACGSSCVARTDAGVGADGNLGRDDGTGALVASTHIDPATYANPAFASGDVGIVARIQGYNGQPNDDAVTFSLYRSTGASPTPNFDDPNQAWAIDSTDLAIGGGTYDSANASTGFVTNGKLVVPGLTSSRIPFNTDSDILLHEVSFTATLKNDPTLNRWRVEDAIGVGRWGLADALKTVAHVQDPTNSHQRICQNTLLYGVVKSQVCAAADLSLVPSGDNQGQICNAISAAVEFDTVPAAFGPVVTPTREDPCAGIDLGNCN